MGVLIVVTLMTNTTDKFIDILNSSIFPIIGLETKIQKVGPTTPILPISGQQNSEVDQKNTDLESTSLSYDTEITPADTIDSAETARQELIKARRARLSTDSSTTE